MIDWEELAQAIDDEIIDVLMSQIGYTDQQRRALILKLLRPVRQELERLSNNNNLICNRCGRIRDQDDL